MMRRELLAATALGTTLGSALWPIAGTAQTSSLHDWSGLYIGASAAANFQHELELELPDADTSFDAYFENGALVFQDTDNLVPTPWPTSFDFDERFAAGGEAGFNFQKGRIVFGLASDFYWLGERSEADFSAFDGPAPDGNPLEHTANVSVEGGVDTLFTLRPRIGVAATDRLLLFATGGLAIGDAHIASSADIDEVYTDQAKSADYAGSRSEILTGFTVGGGAQYAITDRFSVKLDGLYYDLGDLSATIEGTGLETSIPPGITDSLDVQPYEAKMEMKGEIVRLGFTLGF